MLIQRQKNLILYQTKKDTKEKYYLIIHTKGKEVENIFSDHLELIDYLVQWEGDNQDLDIDLSRVIRSIKRRRDNIGQCKVIQLNEKSKINSKTLNSKKERNGKA